MSFTPRDPKNAEKKYLIMKKNIKSKNQTSETHALLNVTYRQILNLYKGREFHNQWMRKPFIIGDFVYSTNAYFICRVSKKKIDFKIENIPQKGKYPVLFVYPTKRNLNFKIKVEDLKLKSNTVPLVDEYEDTNPQGECNECDGDGNVEWEYKRYYNDFDCPICDGKGIIEKEKRTKTGVKVKDNTYYMDILIYRFRISYIDLIIKTAEMLKVDYITILNQTKNRTLIKIRDIELVVAAINKNNDKQNVVFHYA